MPLTSKGEKILKNMKDEYGPDKGEEIFYKSRNKGTITGVDPESSAIRVDVLEAMLEAEQAANVAWSALSDEERRAYATATSNVSKPNRGIHEPLRQLGYRPVTSYYQGRRYYKHAWPFDEKRSGDLHSMLIGAGYKRAADGSHNWSRGYSHVRAEPRNGEHTLFVDYTGGQHVKTTGAVKPKSVRKELHQHLQDAGFNQDKHDTSQEVRRYVKRGFYDGDYPNAHQTNVTTHKYEFSRPDPTGEHAKGVRAKLKSLGFSESLNKDKSASQHTKGQHFVWVTKKNHKTTVGHTHESTSPDREFDRSGRGRGQII